MGSVFRLNDDSTPPQSASDGRRLTFNVCGRAYRGSVCVFLVFRLCFPCVLCSGTEFLCISVLRIALGPRVKLATCKSALNPTVVCSTDRSKAVVPVLVLLFVALWFILRGDLLYVFPCVILFLCFSVLLVLRLPRLGKRELILVLFVRLFGLCLFRFVGFLFLLGSGKGCGL